MRPIATAGNLGRRLIESAKQDHIFSGEETGQLKLQEYLIGQGTEAEFATLLRDPAVRQSIEDDLTLLLRAAQAENDPRVERAAETVAAAETEQQSLDPITIGAGSVLLAMCMLRAKYTTKTGLSIEFPNNELVKKLLDKVNANAIQKLIEKYFGGGNGPV